MRPTYLSIARSKAFRGAAGDGAVGGQKLIWSGRRDFCRPTAVDSNHLPYKDARPKQEFESFLGRLVRTTALSNMWGQLVPAPQHLGATPNAKLAPEQGFEP